MCTTTPNWCAVLSCGIDQGKSRDAQCLGTCTPSGSCKSPQHCNSGGEFLAQSLEVVMESERPVQLYPKIHWDWTGWLTIPGFALAWSSLSRKHGLATFVHDWLTWTLVDHSPATSDTEWLYVDDWTLMVIESSVFTNFHLRDCKCLISQCSLTLFFMLGILIVCMSTGVIEPAVVMGSALLLGQALLALSLSTTQRTWPPFMLSGETFARPTGTTTMH